MIRYISRSVLFYRRVHVVVALAVAVSTAVIGGAMIVGDSIRYSLQEMTNLRLGRITHVVHGRFVREQLAADLADGTSAEVAPALLMTAGVERHQSDDVYRAGSVGITAVNADGWEFFDTADIALPESDQIVLGFRCAQELSATAGDTVSLWVELPSAIPRDSLLGEREEVSAEIQLMVSAVLPETAGASRFSLLPAQQLPLNGFVSLAALQDQLDLQEVRRSRRNPVARPARINTLLIHTNDAEQLITGLQESLTLDDVSLRVRVDPEHGYVSAETDRMILEESVANSVQAATDELGLRTAPALVYLINEFAAADRENINEQYSMYSIVAGVPLQESPPLGPFADADAADDEIIVSQWLADDLEVNVGDRIAARWHQPGSHGDLPEIQQTFSVAHILGADDPVSLDSGLTPHIPGVTDVESFSEWDQPFEMETDRITGRDDAWWAEYRATPKAFVSLRTAQQLWSSRFGNATSIRITADIHPLPTDRLDALARDLTERIPRQLDLTATGLKPLPVLESGLQAAAGANDFTQLFAGFSFFLILSAVILTSLMFRLGIQTRVSQAGLLHAAGLPASRVRWFFLGEGLLVALFGAMVGVLLAIGFAHLMIHGLTTWWIGAIGTRFLQIDIRPFKLAAAAVISLILAGSVIWLAVATLRQSSVRQLLTGQITMSSSSMTSSRWLQRTMIASGLCGLLLPAIAVIGLLPAGEAFSGLTWTMVAFFLGGTGCLTGGLLYLRQRLARSANFDRGVRRLTGFAMVNASRNPWRSLMTTALIASATFLIVAVAAGRRNPLSETPDIDSGNGGFRLIAESSQPILQDLQSENGRVALNIEDRWQQAGLTETASVYSFQSRRGEDASCINLFQTHLPTLLGASDRFIKRGGFRFANTRGQNPWTLLNTRPETDDDLPVYPVIGDMNTLMYSLKKGVGDTIAFPDEQNPTARLQIVAMLDGSLFQGVLVMSQDHLKRLDPDVAGYQYFLAEADSAAMAGQLATVLESGLNAWGMDTEPVSVRLAGFLAVQNTYLSTFQMLGGLGLLVGVFGLAVVMVRNVMERRGEIALLRAIGFTGFRICRLILIENSVLLLWGIGLGAAAALLAMLPHLLSTGGDLPWRSLAVTLASVAITGLLSPVVAIRRAQQITVRNGLTIDT